MLVIKIFCCVMAIYCLIKAKDHYEQKKRLKALIEFDPFTKTEE